MWPTIYLAATVNDMVLFKVGSLKNRFYAQEKKSILKVRREKKDKLFYLNRRKKPIITISKPFQPTQHELRKNTKWKKTSKLPY